MYFFIKTGRKLAENQCLWMVFRMKSVVLTSMFFILRTNDRCTQNFLYFWLDQPEMTQKIRNLNTNAAQTGINQASVKGLPIFLPPKSLIDQFEEVSEHLLAELFNLAKKNINLRKTRDLLLPKLINGEIDVEKMNITIEN